MKRGNKVRLFSGRTLPIIILVVLPVVITVLSYQTNQPTIYTVFGYEIVPIDSLYILSFVYAVCPIRHSSRALFKESDPKNKIDEFICVKNILYVIVPIFISLVIYEKVFSFNYYYGFLYDYYIVPVGANFSYSVIAGIIWLVIHTERKEFRFYFAKACISIITDKINDIKRLNYLLMGLKSYDKYLQKNLKLQINNLPKTYSMIIFDSNIDENEVIKSISAAFISEDKLKPAKYLSKISHLKNPEDFLIDKSFAHEVKDLAIFFATIVPVVIAIIQLFLQSPKQ
ncbi:MAG TPA: hypothetical protein VH481_06760 [Nitrososphaeraceae archaeon]